jgi:hypothetical protein
MDKIIPTKQCLTCSRTFQRPYNYGNATQWSKSKFCSIECRIKYGRITVTCPVCGKQFDTLKCRHRKYCSRNCSNKANPPPRQGVITGKTCVTCGKEFFVKGKKRRLTQLTCSKSCRRGALHPNWREGKTPLFYAIRQSVEYKEWRMAVYKRDYWTCRLCKIKQKHPVAHHIKSFREYPELRFDVNNGMTLCRSCHKKVHKEIGSTTRFVGKVQEHQ